MKKIFLLSTVIILGNMVSLKTVAQSDELIIDCSGLSNTTVECNGDLPFFNNLEEFIAAGGSVSSATYDIDTFGFSDTSNGNFCPEIITRSYFIINTNGDTARCSMQFVIQDVTSPLLILPDKQCDCCNTYPVYSSITEVLAYQADGNQIADNCALDSVGNLTLIEENIRDTADLIIYERTYQLGDRCGNTTAALEKIYLHHNLAPIVVNDSATTTINTAIDISVTANDYDPYTNLSPLSLSVVIGPSHGNVLIDKQTGTITYTPDADYVGSDIFRYTICDDAIPCMPECGEAIVFITVQGNVTTAVALNEITNNSAFTIFPNPTNGQFKIELKEADTAAQIKIVDSMGHLVREMNHHPYGSRIIDIDLSDCPCGTYAIILTQNQKKSSKQIVIK